MKPFIALCDCGAETIQVHLSVDTEDGFDGYITFSSWWNQNRTWRERLRVVWLILRGKSHYFDAVVLDREDTERLHTYLSSHVAEVADPPSIPQPPPPSFGTGLLGADQDASPDVSPADGPGVVGSGTSMQAPARAVHGPPGRVSGDDAGTDGGGEVPVVPDRPRDKWWEIFP